MAKASAPKIIDGTKKQSTSSAKLGDADIPKIILEERRSASSSLPSSLQTSLYSTTLPTQELSCNQPDAAGVDIRKNDSDTGSLCQGARSHMPIRSSSDIGLPTGKTSSLAPSDGMGNNENYLEVFYSPRIQRKSIDSEINSKPRGFCHYEWLQTLDSSNSCLKVLSSTSRTGSALSLNSEYTARSIGLLSNDSDSDRDLSLSESDRVHFKPSQLRRFMSYTDEDLSPELCARSSQSLGDLNTTETIAENFELDSSITQESLNFSGNVTASSESATLSISEDRPGSQCDPVAQEREAQIKDSLTERSKGVESMPNKMVSYKYDSHDATRDIRIRQWLQDMNFQN